MKRLLPLLVIVALSACGPAPEPSQPDTLPTPSGPPLAQQPAPQPAEPASPDTPQWESVVRRSATSLRLIDGGTTSLEMSCLPRPARLVVRAYGFKIIESEDRFSLGVGDEPVTLVADLRKRNGVTADAPIPDNFAQLLREAKHLSARYGNQRIGPVPAPPQQLVRAFTDACEKLAR